MKNKIKTYKQFLNEEKDFILNNDTVKTYTWTSKGVEYSFKYHIGYDIFQNRLLDVS